MKPDRTLLLLVAFALLLPVNATDYHEGETAVWVANGDTFTMNNQLVVVIGSVRDDWILFTVGTTTHRANLDEITTLRFPIQNQTRFVHVWLTEVHGARARVRLTSNEEGFSRTRSTENLKVERLLPCTPEDATGNIYDGKGTYDLLEGDLVVLETNCTVVYTGNRGKSAVFEIYDYSSCGILGGGGRKSRQKLESENAGPAVLCGWLRLQH
ncbi:MAG TPA: hypothetical protein ENN60_00030 [archaeon]|nr:hypothetical protein [archaeon]